MMIPLGPGAFLFFTFLRALFDLSRVIGAAIALFVGTGFKLLIASMRSALERKMNAESSVKYIFYYCSIRSFERSETSTMAA